MTHEQLTAGTIIQLGDNHGRYSGAIVQIRDDFDYIYFEDEDGNEIDCPWSVEFYKEHSVYLASGDIRVYRKGTTTEVNLLDDDFTVINIRSNKPDWF